MQQAQIYIRYNDGKKKRLIAKSYKDSSPQSMVSRARWGISFLVQTFGIGSKQIDEETAGFLSRIMNIDFDRMAIEEGSDIAIERTECYPETDFNEYVFHDQDNQGGKLLIDVADGNVKYAFLDWKADPERIMNADVYMRWCAGNGWKHSADISKDEVSKCEENIDYLKEHAALMTKDEVFEYLTYNYDDNFMQF